MKNKVQLLAAVLVAGSLVLSNFACIYAAEPVSETDTGIVSEAEDLLVQDQEPEEKTESSGGQETAQNAPEDELELSQPSVKAMVDTQPPVLQSIEFEPSSLIVSAPAEIKVTVHATDDLSGISNVTISFGASNEYVIACAISGEDFHDGVGTGIIKIGAGKAIKEYALDSIELEDCAGNDVWYVTDDDYEYDENEIYYPHKYTIKVIGNKRESNPPTLGNVSISTNEVIAPGKIDITAFGQDDTDVKGCLASFKNRSSDDVIDAYFGNVHDSEGWPYFEPLFRNGPGTSIIDVTKYDDPGDYYLSHVEISDVFDNVQHYYASVDEKGYKDSRGDKLLTDIPEFHVTNEDKISDHTAPELLNVAIENHDLIAPGKVRLQMDIKENDQINNVKARLRLSDHVFKFANNMEIEEKSDEPGVFRVICIYNFDQYTKPGNYYLEYVQIQDNSYNTTRLRSDHMSSDDEYSSCEPDLPSDIYVSIINSPKGDLQTNTGSTTLIQDIKAMGNGQTAEIAYDINPMIPKGVFDAIRGTNKTLFLAGKGGSSGFTNWTFHGKDIKSTGRNVNLDMETVSPNSNKIKEIIGVTTPVVFLSFTDRQSALPGKAKIQTLLADSKISRIGSTTGLYIYSYDENAQRLSPVATNISLSNDWLEFDITRTGDYILTKGEVSRLFIPTNNGGSSGGHSGGGGGGGGGKGGGGGGSASANLVKAATVTKSATAAVTNSISNALKANLKTTVANIPITAGTEISSATVKSVVKAINAAAKNKGVAITPAMTFTKTSTGKVASSISFNPMKFTSLKNVQLGVTLDDKASRTALSKLYRNNMQMVKFTQTGAFGMDVTVTAKLNLTGMNTKTLQFYTYDRTKKTLTQITLPNYSIDKNGYLHFTTNMGNTVIITDSVLQKK